jgi:EpsI family protein
VAGPLAAEGFGPEVEDDPMNKSLVALGFLALNFYIYQWFASAEVIPPRQSFAHFPLQLGSWSCPERGVMDEPTLKNLGASDYLICDYQRQDPAGFVGLYIGYHETQIRTAGGGSADANPIHPPKHCLPGSGWDIIAQSKISLDLPGLPQRPAEVNRFVIAKGEARQLVYYWYQTQGRVVADDWQKIAYLSWDRARSGRTDGSLVRFTVPLIHGDDARAEKEVMDLATLVLPLLPAYVPN